MTDWMEMTINAKSDHENVSNKWIKWFLTTLLFRYITYVTKWYMNWNKTQYKLRSESREFHVFSSLRWETALMSRSNRAVHRPISERCTVRGRGECLRISPEDGLVVPRLSLLRYRSSIKIRPLGHYSRWHRQINFRWYRGPRSEEMKNNRSETHPVYGLLSCFESCSIRAKKK